MAIPVSETQQRDQRDAARERTTAATAAAFQVPKQKRSDSTARDLPTLSGLVDIGRRRLEVRRDMLNGPQRFDLGDAHCRGIPRRVLDQRFIEGRCWYTAPGIDALRDTAINMSARPLPSRSRTRGRVARRPSLPPVWKADVLEEPAPGVGLGSAGIRRRARVAAGSIRRPAPRVDEVVGGHPGVRRVPPFDDLAAGVSTVGLA